MGLLTGITDTLGLTDSGAAERSMDKATGLTKKQMQLLEAIDLPDVEKMRIALEAPELIGQLAAEQLGPSALEDVSTDPRLAGMQMEALQAMQDRAESGLTQADKYDIEEALGQAAGQERAQRASIEQEMARRGMADSGQGLMMKLQAQQASANQGRKQSMDIARQAAQQKQAALQQMGQMAGQMEGQQFNRAAQVASAKDRIAAANAANRQTVAGQNLAARQSIENQRAALANQQQMYNKGLAQQQFQNQLAKAGAQGQAAGNLANMYSGQAQAQAGADAATMQTIGNLGAAFIGAKDGGVINKYKCGGVHYASDGMGGVVDSGMESYEGDRVDAKINDGEMILNVPQQQRMMDMIRGRISPEELGEDDIVEGVPREYAEELHEEGGKDLKVEGLKKLLEALGK